MSRHIDFQERGWNEYLYWQTQDKKTLKRINKLIHDIIRNGNIGIGNPEPLRKELSGWWSRRIDDTNRLVYRLVDDDILEISQCKGHYQMRRKAPPFRAGDIRRRFGFHALKTQIVIVLEM